MATATKTGNKRDLVRLAIQAKGKDATREELAAWILENHHVGMNLDTITNYRGAVLKAMRRERAGKGASVRPANHGRTGAGNGQALPLTAATTADVATIREMVGLIGAERAIRFVQACGRLKTQPAVRLCEVFG